MAKKTIQKPMGGGAGRPVAAKAQIRLRENIASMSTQELQGLTKRTLEAAAVGGGFSKGRGRAVQELRRRRKSK